MMTFMSAIESGKAVRDIPEAVRIAANYDLMGVPTRSSYELPIKYGGIKLIKYQDNDTTRLTSMDELCFLQAMVNKEIYKRDLGLDLKIMFGALGFGKDDKNGIWFEYGEKDGSVNIWTKDIHAWLEDDQANVYDMFQPSWTTLAKQNNKIAPEIKKRLINGMTKQELKSKGLVYVSAPDIFQAPAMRHICHGLVRQTSAILSQM